LSNGGEEMKNLKMMMLTLLICLFFISNMSLAASTQNFKVGDAYYDTLAEAYDAAPINGTIFVNQSRVVDDSEVIIKKPITIDVQKNELIKMKYGIVNESNLTIKGYGTLRTAVMETNDVEILIHNKGNVTIENLRIESNGLSSDYVKAKSASNNSFHATSTSIDTTAGLVTIDGASVKASGASNQTSNAITMLGKADVIIRNGIIESKNGPAISSWSSENSHSTGTLDVESGTVLSDTDRAIYFFATGNRTCETNLIIRSGTIQTNSNSRNISAILLNKTDNGTTSGAVTIRGGTIIAKGGQALTCNGTSMVTIGQTDTTIHTASPVLQGKTYGIVSANGFNFQDGAIKGGIEAIYLGSAKAKQTPDEYEVAYTNEIIFEDKYEVAYLSQNPNYSVMKNNQKKFYASLERAYLGILGLDNRGTTGTIVVERTHLGDESSFSVANGMNITLDTNGKLIMKKENEIVNQGTLRIIGSGSITSTTLNNLIENKGTLIVGTKDGTVNRTAPVLQGKDYAIYSTGRISFYDGVLKGGNAGHYGTIADKETGYVIQTTIQGNMKAESLISENASGITVDVVGKYNGIELAKSTENPTEVALGGTINVSATSTDKVTSIKYAWAEGGNGEVTGNGGSINIPSTFIAGNTYYLTLTPYIGTTAYSEKKYILRISTGIDIEVVLNSNTKMKNGDSVEAKVGDKIEITASPKDKVSAIKYIWDNKTSSNWSTVNNSNMIQYIPTQLVTGSHKLYVYVIDKNNKMTEVKTYTFILKNGNNTGETSLEVLPWEEQNYGAQGVSLLLRNDSLSKKANKNIYALNELVTYYIDFYNGEKDIGEAVTLTLKLPINFYVVDANGGKVDTSARTISWTYANGMELNRAGTKKVILRYTALSSESKTVETIYPMASIGTSHGVMDKSSVINMVYKGSGTTLDLVHASYMYGDANATTFRPDNTITRAEGALVLVRILFGQDAINSAAVTNVFPDIGETYLEAQKAISVATNFGIINGYTDGYYRPNRTMTRAELMKILATYMEKDAQRKGIEGLELKATNKLAKVYNNPVTEYIVNGKVVTEHWALAHISLLNRLNMTSVSETETDLRIDKGITRAEVTQLVNYYLLRAPAQVNSNTYIGFSDVSRSHKLAGDIVEATRNTHLFQINSNANEIVE